MPAGVLQRLAWNEMLESYVLENPLPVVTNQGGFTCEKFVDQRLNRCFSVPVLVEDDGPKFFADPVGHDRAQEDVVDVAVRAVNILGDDIGRKDEIGDTGDHKGPQSPWQGRIVEQVN
jgi:hypothetical protein